MTSSRHSVHVDAFDDASTRPTPQPRAVVLLFGWWGAVPRHLGKYGELYQAENCLTVQVVADKYAIMTNNTASMDECVQEAVEHVAAMLRSIENEIPVIVHCFSNGGAYLVKRLEILIQQARKQPYGNDDLILVGDRLNGELFDSAPAYPSRRAGTRAMKDVFRGAFLRSIIYVLFSLNALMDWIAHHVFKRPIMPIEFWEHMTQSKACLNQAFVYSAADDITNVQKLDELVEARRKINHHTLVERFDDSLHVQHLRKHPDAYQKLVRSFLTTLTTKE